MRRGRDIAVRVKGLYLVHQNLPGRRIAKYARREHLFFIPLQGEIHITVGNLSLRCGPGRMAYLPPETEHAFDSSGDQGERLICLIDHERWHQSGPVPAFGGTVLPVSQLCKELLFYLLLHPRTGAALTIVDLLVQTLLESLDGSQGVLEVEHLEGKSRDWRVKAAMDYLNRNLRRRVSIREAAEHAGASTRTLNRLFLREFGLPPQRVLALLRVAKARELLATGRFSVTEVAWKVGYSSLSQFIAVFRRVTGQLPSEFARFGSAAVR